MEAFISSGERGGIEGGGRGAADDRQDDCLRQSCDPYVGSCYLLCDGADADHCVCVCVWCVLVLLV